jgi:CBS domain-containing protein
MRVLKHVIAGRQLHVIEPDAMVLAAARLMTEQKVSSLPVVSGDRLVGILTERDLVQRVMARRVDPDVTPVSEVMSRGLVFAGAEDTYDAARARMTRDRVRHLLVVEGSRLLGVVSMRDLLALDAAEKAEEIELLTAYIHTIPPDLPPLELGDVW